MSRENAFQRNARVHAERYAQEREKSYNEHSRSVRSTAADKMTIQERMNGREPYTTPMDVIHQEAKDLAHRESIAVRNAELKAAADHAAQASSGTHSPQLDKIQERKAMRETLEKQLIDKAKEANSKLDPDARRPGDRYSTQHAQGEVIKLISGNGQRDLKSYRLSPYERTMLRHIGGSGDQPRVPAGSPDGGQWTKG